MKRSTVVKVLALVVAGLTAITFLPSGGGQHYAAKLVDQAAAATGKLTGGGSGTAAFADGNTIQDSTTPQPNPSPSAASGGDIAASLLGPPTQKKFHVACITLRDDTGAIADRGCTGAFQPGNMVDLLLTTGTIKFTTGSFYYSGGTLSANIVLTGTGPYSIGLLPPLIRLELGQRDFEVVLGLLLSRGAIAVGTITSSSVTWGGMLINGYGVMSRSLGLSLQLCSGPCEEPSD